MFILVFNTTHVMIWNIPSFDDTGVFFNPSKYPLFHRVDSKENNHLTTADT